MARILIVDDASFMRMALKNFLTAAGYEIAGEAVNGLDAIEKYKALKPDLVMLDTTMPEMDGVQALKEILKIDPEAKVLMCAVMGQQAMLIEAVTSGAKAFLMKPYSSQRILEEVEKILA